MRIGLVLAALVALSGCGMFESDEGKTAILDSWDAANGAILPEYEGYVKNDVDIVCPDCGKTVRRGLSEMSRELRLETASRARHTAAKMRAEVEGE